MRPSALYYSVKLDLEREGRYNADGTVQPPYCDIYNSETGIHEPLYRAESAAKPDERTTCERKIGAGGTTFMTLNKSIRYMNYCQAHWDLPKSDRKHWLIVDTHAADPAVDPTHDCRTVTIAPFDPHPSVTTSVPSASRRVYADAVRQLMLHNTILETPMEAVAYPSSVVSSIEEALADGNESPAEYYNFSGMRVGVNPPPGVYIRRRGTVVDKVVIRQ